jgi:hypothetical protein
MIDLCAIGIAANPHGAVEQRVACPQCAKGSRDTALSVNIADGRFHCFRCGWRGRAGGGERLGRVPVRTDDPAVIDRKRERLRRTWKETVPLTHRDARAVRNYLEARALHDVLSSPPGVLRAHPSLAYWDALKNLGTYPAMVALFHGANGSPVTLHVTYLRSDGFTKANVPNPKKILGVPVTGATRGGAIHLHEPSVGTLGIAEGIESALSLHLIQKIPVWASFCAGNLEHVQMPSSLRELYVAVDIDPSGKGAQVANGLVKRVNQISPLTKTFLVEPEVDGIGDLNDELRRRVYGRR